MQGVENQLFIFDVCFSVLRKAPFLHVILPVSWPEMHNITPSNGRNHGLKRALSECQVCHSALHCRVYKKSVWLEMGFIVLDLTFLYISFAIFFCQKKVKKIRGSVARVFFKSADMRSEKECGMCSCLLW